MMNIMGSRIMRSFRGRSSKPLIASVSLRVHVKEEQEYHSRAYVIRIFGLVTEFLVADKDKKLKWIDISNLDVVEE